MSHTVRQVGQVSAQLKSQIEQFQQNLDQNDVHIGQLKDHFTGSNIQLETLATSISRREADSERIKDSLNFADIFVNSLHQSTSVLDNDAMRTSRLWESVFTTGPGTGEYYNRSFSSGRVAFSVPSQYFESIADRALVDSTTMEQLCTELSKIEDYYLYQIKEGKRPGEIDEKVRAAMIQKINELKMSNAFSK